MEDEICKHGIAMNVHCCNCHSGFLFYPEDCICEIRENYILISKKEAIAFARCPFSNCHASENNYPGFNDVINKILKFAQS